MVKAFVPDWIQLIIFRTNITCNTLIILIWMSLVFIGSCNYILNFLLSKIFNCTPLWLLILFSFILTHHLLVLGSTTEPLVELLPSNLYFFIMVFLFVYSCYKFQSCYYWAILVAPYLNWDRNNSASICRLIQDGLIQLLICILFSSSRV